MNMSDHKIIMIGKTDILLGVLIYMSYRLYRFQCTYHDEMIQCSVHLV